MSTARICIAGLGFAVCVLAQAPRSPYAAVSGIVLNNATGAPLPRAVVTLSTLDDPPLEAVTFSESNGAFGFTAIPPGRYQLRVEMDGFQRAWFGASTPDRPHGTLNLAAGVYRYGITFRLRPLGSISGMVMDQDGDPVPAEIRLLKATWERMKPAYRNEGWAHADASGRYHFDDVVPGQYIVMAHPSYMTFVTQSTITAGQPETEKMYAAQFYADSSSLSGATPVQLDPGKHLEDIDFHLMMRAVAPLDGRVVLPADVSTKAFAMVRVFSQDVPDDMSQSQGAGASPPNFNFEISNTTVGAYVITASTTVDGREYQDAERIDLPPGGEQLALNLRPAIDLAGRVDLEGALAGLEHPFRVTLFPVGFPPGRQRREAEMKPDGSFVAHNVSPGIWDIGVEPIPPGGYLKSMRLGDQDVLTEDMTIDGDTHAPLRIVVSTRGAVVSGTVTVPKGAALSPRASVLLAPSGRYAQVWSFYKVGTADDSGHFEFKGVTPGRYQLFAFEEMDPEAFEDPGFLEPFEKLSPVFDVPEGGDVDRKTQLIPAASQGAARN